MSDPTPVRAPAGPRIVFAGTPDFAATVLAALLAAGARLAGVLTQPDRPAGRGRRERPGPVKRLATAHRLPVLQPPTLRDAQAVRALAALSPELVVVAAYGLILPRPVLDLPRLGCVNVHASLLPRWRGAAPIARALLAGDRETGVSLMLMDEGLDTGPVLARAACPIRDDDTAGTLHDRLAGLGARLLVDALPDLARGRLRPEPQDDARATFAPRIEKSEARIDWRRPAVAIERQVRAFDPWPVAFTTLPPAAPGERGGRLRVWRAALAGAPRAPGTAPGTVMTSARDGIEVATGEGVLRLLEIQAEGARRMTVAEWLNAHRLPPGRVLGAGDG